MKNFAHAACTFKLAKHTNIMVESVDELVRDSESSFAFGEWTLLKLYIQSINSLKRHSYSTGKPHIVRISGSVGIIHIFSSVYIVCSSHIINDAAVAGVNRIHAGVRVFSVHTDQRLHLGRAWLARYIYISDTAENDGRYERTLC